MGQHLKATTGVRCESAQRAPHSKRYRLIGMMINGERLEGNSGISESFGNQQHNPGASCRAHGDLVLQVEPRQRQGHSMWVKIFPQQVWDRMRNKTQDEICLYEKPNAKLAPVPPTPPRAKKAMQHVI